MLTPDRISIVLPQTSAEISAIAMDIISVARAFRRGGEDKPDSAYQGFVDWLKTAPHVLTMAYVDGLPAGWIRIDDHNANPAEVGRKVLEFSGAVLPEWEGQGLTEYVAPIAIDRAFVLSGKKKMVATLDSPNPKAAAALERLGFEYRTTDVSGKRVYRLLRMDAHAPQLAEV